MALCQGWSLFLFFLFVASDLFKINYEAVIPPIVQAACESF